MTDDGLDHIGPYVDAELARLERLARIEVLVEMYQVLVVLGELMAQEIDLLAA